QAPNDDARVDEILEAHLATMRPVVYQAFGSGPYTMFPPYCRGLSQETFVGATVTSELLPGESNQTRSFSKSVAPRLRASISLDRSVVLLWQNVFASLLGFWVETKCLSCDHFHNVARIGRLPRKVLCDRCRPSVWRLQLDDDTRQERWRTEKRRQRKRLKGKK